MKIKPEETIQIQGPYGEINGILTPCIEENTAAPVLVLAHGFRGSMDGGGRAAVLAEMASECCNAVPGLNSFLQRCPRHLGGSLMQHAIQSLPRILACCSMAQLCH